MSILSRYLASNLIKTTLLILLVFISLEIFILLAIQLNSLGKGSYNLWQAFRYILLVLPQETYALFPIAGLLGMLLGLNQLANHSELLVLRTAGLAPQQILRYSLQAGLILVIFITLIGEGLGPKLKHLAETRKLAATSSGQALALKEGLWLRQGNDFYYIKTIYSPKHLADISRFHFNDQQQLMTASFARQGFYHNHHWQMRDIKQSQLSTTLITTHDLASAEWNLALNPSLLKISSSRPSEMNLKQLNEFIHYLEANHLSALTYQLAFWQRLLQPFASLVLMLLAVPFVFGSLRQLSSGFRLILGIITGFVFYLFNQLFPALSQTLNFSPFLASLLPVLLFAAFGLILLARIR